MTVYGTGHVVAETLVFHGTLTGADFAFGTDGHGGTDLTDPAHQFAPSTAPHDDVARDGLAREPDAFTVLLGHGLHAG